MYDGTPLYNHGYHYEGQLQEGHTLEMDIQGVITGVGEIKNKFTAIIRNENGEDVSDQYRIRNNFGTLIVVPNNGKPIIEFQVYDIKMVYRDEVVKHSFDDYWIPSDNLPSNHTVSFDIRGELKEAGRIITYIDRGSFRILDENQIDVTNQYNVVFYDGSIEVLTRNITVTSFSAEKYYDGEPLTSDIFYISQGTLIEGDEIFVEIVGSQTEIGMSSNLIASVQITNVDGIDVTKNYGIKTVEGDLVVVEE